MGVAECAPYRPAHANRDSRNGAEGPGPNEGNTAPNDEGAARKGDADGGRDGGNRGRAGSLHGGPTEFTRRERGRWRKIRIRSSPTILQGGDGEAPGKRGRATGRVEPAVRRRGPPAGQPGGGSPPPGIESGAEGPGNRFRGRRATFGAEGPGNRAGGAGRFGVVAPGNRGGEFERFEVLGRATGSVRRTVRGSSRATGEAVGRFSGRKVSGNRRRRAREKGIARQSVSSDGR